MADEKEFAESIPGADTLIHYEYNGVPEGKDIYSLAEDDFDIRGGGISAEKAAEVCDLCSEEEEKLSEFAGRLTATAEETACARHLRDRLSPRASTRMEAFKTSPYAGRNCCSLLAAVFLLSAVLYYVSFAGGRAFGTVMSLTALLFFAVGTFLAGAMFLGSRRLVKLLPKKNSYNVFSQNMPCGKQKDGRLLVIASNHDAPPGSYFANFDSVRKAVFAVAPASMLLFMLFCVIKAVAGADNTAAIVTLTVFPCIFALAGIAALLLHFSPSKRHARENNGVGTAVALALYEYLLDRPDLLPDGTRVCFVSFGGENSAHAGSRAFAAAHPEIKGAKAIVFGDINGGEFRLVRKDALRNIQFSRISATAVASASEKSGVPCAVMRPEGVKSKLNALHGYTADALAAEGCDTVMFTAKDYAKDEQHAEKEDAGRLFALALNTVLKITEDNNDESRR